jgi:hypothetical protein
VGAAAAVFVALPTVAAGALDSSPSAPARIAANEMTFTDSSGEDATAPDITTLVVSNNDAGVITIRINVPNRATFTQDMLILLFADTDNNPATGDPESLGADYVIQLFGGEAALFRWDGSDFTRRPGDPASTSLLFQYQGGVTITITAAEFGNTARFGFAAIVLSGIAIDPVTGDIDFTNAKSDVAPAAGSGFFNYSVLVAKPTLVVRRLASTPAAPRAGRPFTLRMTTARSDTGALLQSGRVTCVGRVGNARLRVQLARVVSGAATCTWQIPPAAKGKTFRGTVTVVFEGLRVTRSISRRIG